MKDGKWEQGDIIVKGTDKRKILGVCGEVIFPSYVNDFNSASTNPYTQYELESHGWSLEQTQAEKHLAEIKADPNKEITWGYKDDWLLYSEFWRDDEQAVLRCNNSEVRTRKPKLTMIDETNFKWNMEAWVWDDDKAEAMKKRLVGFSPDDPYGQGLVFFSSCVEWHKIASIEDPRNL